MQQITAHVLGAQMRNASFAETRPISLLFSIEQSSGLLSNSDFVARMSHV
jgi:hypothetical protein